MRKWIALQLHAIGLRREIRHLKRYMEKEITNSHNERMELIEQQHTEILNLKKEHERELQSIRTEEREKWEKVIHERNTEIGRLNAIITDNRDRYLDIKRFSTELDEIVMDVGNDYDSALKIFANCIRIIKNASRRIGTYNKQLERFDDKIGNVLERL